MSFLKYILSEYFSPILCKLGKHKWVLYKEDKTFCEWCQVNQEVR